MPIREATWEDLLPASKVLAAAFKDEPAIGGFIHPNWDKYPDDPYLWFLRSMRIIYYGKPDHRLIVSYKVDATGAEECITGAAYWHRKRAKTQQPSLYIRALIKYWEAYNYLESFVYPNRAIEPSRADVLQQAEPFTKHHWTGTRAETWYLDLIGVDPSAEKRGYGREMVKYGFGLAKEDGVGCSVIGAEGRENFYRSCGFNVDCGRAADEGGDANPLVGIPGGSIHFWDNGILPHGVKKYGEA